MQPKERSELRVANVIEDGRLGGPQIRMVRVAAALGDKVETIIVMPRSSSDPFAAMCREHAIPYQRLALSRMSREWPIALRYVTFSPWEVLRLAKLFRRERVDLVHASGGSWQVKAVLAARLVRVPSIWHLNDTAMPRFIHGLFHVVQPLAAGFVFASHRTQAYYEGASGGRPRAIIPSTVDPIVFGPEARYRGDEGILDTLGDAPVIGTVANANPIKGLDGLVRAAALLLPRYPNLKVVVVGQVFGGQADYFAGLQALAKDLGVSAALSWVGPRRDVRPLLRRMDVYVCSSVAESSPMSVWEAMAMGRPVVSTDVGDVPLHVEDGKTGYVVPPGSAEALADRIDLLLSNPAQRQKIGQAAREHAIATFSPEVVAGMTLDIYRRVLAAGRRSAE